MTRNTLRISILATQLATSASSVAAKGSEVVLQVIEIMGAIRASSSKVVDITSVIDSIAFQTNTHLMYGDQCGKRQICE